MKEELLKLYKEYIEEIKKKEKDYYSFPGGLLPMEQSFEGFIYWLENDCVPLKV